MFNNTYKNSWKGSPCSPNYIGNYLIHFLKLLCKIISESNCRYLLFFNNKALCRNNGIINKSSSKFILWRFWLCVNVKVLIRKLEGPLLFKEWKLMLMCCLSIKYFVWCSCYNISSDIIFLGEELNYSQNWLNFFMWVKCLTFLFPHSYLQNPIYPHQRIRWVSPNILIRRYK